jgi:uncharacterized protein (TIGR02996 family)
MSERVGDVEAKFIEAIRNDPQDDEVRRVYADWLDERGDPRGEYLRLEIQVYRGPQRLAELAGTFDPLWLRTVQRLYRLVFVSSPNKIGTIKLVREITGLGLKDSKDVVDRGDGSVIADRLELEQAREYYARFAGIATVRVEPEVLPMTPPTAPLVEVEPEYTAVMVSVRAGARLGAIRRVREVVPGISLQSAKQLVDRVVAGTPTVVQEAIGRRDAQRITELFAEIAEVRCDPRVR